MRKKIVILIGMLLLGTVLVNIAGYFLVVDEKPVKSDVIIVLSGGQGRLEKGVKLYKEGYAPYLLLTNGSEEQLYERALALGVPTDHIFMEDKSASTLDNAIYSKEIMLEKHFKSAIVVSSNSHMRRVKILYDQTFRNSGIRLTYMAGENQTYNPSAWWVEESNRKTTISEYIKLVGNLLGYHGTESKKVLKKIIWE